MPCVAAASGLLMLTWSFYSASAQTLVCGQAPQPPRIDAQPKDACWKDAMIATDFSVLGSGGAKCAFRQTTLRAAWDQTALYLHAICLEPDPASITSEVAERDGPVWLEDCLEIFLQPDTEEADYFHFVINADGVLYDERNTDARFDANLRIATYIGDQAWQAELAIPWSELSVEAPSAAAAWGFNIGRAHRPKEPKEWSTWAPLQAGLNKFAVPKLWGRLNFARDPTAGRAADLRLPRGIVANPDFTELVHGWPKNWHLREHSTFSEIVPASRHYAIRNDGDYCVAAQPLNVPVKAGDVFTVFAVVRGSPDATAGIAAVQEMEDGSPDDLYPFWSISVSESFRMYSGRIVADKGAKRLMSLNLYRSNRKGWVEYAYVEILPGIHGVAGIVEAERCTGNDERGIGAPWPTPAVAAYKPLLGGPLKTLIFIGEFQRDAAELAQRLDMDYDLVYCPTYRGSGQVDSVVAFGAEKILRKLVRHEYDLIILAGRPSEESVVDGIIESVAAGAGLLAIEPLAGGEAARPEVLQRLLGGLPEDVLPPDRLSEVLGGLDPDVLDATSNRTQALRSLAIREFGNGRVARLTWSEEVPGLIPFAPGTCEYWEYRWAALCKAALWAARRQPGSPNARARVISVVCGEKLTIHVAADRPDPLTLSVEWDTPFGIVSVEKSATPAITGGKATVVLDVNSNVLRTRGPSIARVLLSDDEQPLDFAACVVRGAEPRVEIAGVESPREARPGETIPVSVHYQALPGGDVVVQAELVDAFDRVVARDSVSSQGVGPHEAQMELQVRQPLSVYHRIVVTARDGDVCADRAERDLFVPEANASHLDDFHLAAGYAAMHVRCPEYLQRHLTSFLRAQQVTAVTVNEYMIKRGMPAWGGTVGGSGLRCSVDGHVREHCLSNPDQVRALAEGTVVNVGKRRHWGFFGYNMNDEVHLGQQEVCASEYCAQAFRDWARKEYKTIEAVNDEWGTSYRQFDDIDVPLLAAMKGESNPARWVDFRLFMERVWANAYAAAHHAVRAAYPDVNLSFTNPNKYDSLSGVDFSLWVPHEEVLLRYCPRHAMDRNRSWTRAPILSWFGYHSDAAQCGHFVWWFALNGGVVPIWWDPVEPWAYSRNEGFTPWYLCGPLWRPTGRSQAVKAAASDLQQGIGKVLRLAKPARAEAAILHSQASMHVLYAEAGMEKGGPTSEGYDRYRASDDAFAAALKRHALSYRYVLLEDVIRSRLSGVQLIVLPACVALSDETVDALKAFVHDGGKLIADAMPAIYDAHGKPRDRSPLADVFALDGAVCLGALADENASGTIEQAIASLGMRPTVRWRTADGDLPAYTELYRFQLDRAEFLGIVRSPVEEAAEEGPLTIMLPRARYIYDCRAGKLLGRMQELTVELPPGDARFLALLRYAPDGVAVEATVEDQTLVITASVHGLATPGDHVFRVEVTPPHADAPVFWYCSNILAPDGKAQLCLPLALNDPRGQWHVTVCDVATGLVGEAMARWEDEEKRGAHMGAAEDGVKWLVVYQGDPLPQEPQWTRHGDTEASVEIADGALHLVDDAEDDSCCFRVPWEAEGLRLRHSRSAAHPLRSGKFAVPLSSTSRRP